MMMIGIYARITVTTRFACSLAGMSEGFNELLEFAEDGEEDDKLPSNLFDDLDGDEDER